MRTRLDDTVLDTGQCYNNGDGLTIGCFYALDFVKHFGRVQTGSNISIAMHSYLAAMIGSAWYTYTKNDKNWSISQHEFTTLCLFHDVAEALVGDVWRPAKTKEVRDQEEKVHNAIMKFITIDTKIANEFKHEQEKIDNCAQFVELIRYLEISPGHKVFTEIGTQMAKTMVTEGMEDFCLINLGLSEHEIAVALLTKAKEK
jgi:5'-deoxynucleotidase YfbR-like HD superfamily hydrolase